MMQTLHSEPMRARVHDPYAQYPQVRRILLFINLLVIKLFQFQYYVYNALYP